jgi:hypothetical protein
VPIIINGGSNCAGWWWAKHLENADKNERVDLIEFKGLFAETVPSAFREMEGIAAGTRCKNFFYQANINPREDERLTPGQWREAIDQLEKNLGLAGQPRFVIEHEKKGRTHRHVIWSRIDAEHMRAIPDSLTAVIHERTSRELEKRFGLEPGKSILLPGREDGRPGRGPKKWEQANAERHNISPSEAKAFITDLWRTTDTGKALKAALEAHGWMLARGDKTTSQGRAYLMAIDPDGGMHQLARRVDRVKAALVHARVADIDPASLPSVEAAKTRQHARQAERENRQAHDIAAARAMHEAQQAAKGRKDDTRASFAAAGARVTEPEAPIFDRDAADRAWATKVMQAAIAKEEAARGPREDAQDRSERTAGEARAGQGAAAGPQQDMRPLGKTAGDIRTAWTLSRTTEDLIEALAAHGIMLAIVSPEEARQSVRAAAFAKEVGNFAPVLREGEIVAVNGHGDVHRLDQRTTGALRPEIEARLDGFAGVDRAGLSNVTDAKAAMREAEHAAWRDRRDAAREQARPPSRIEIEIAGALKSTMTGHEFAAAIDKAELAIARATVADVLVVDALREQEGFDRAGGLAHKPHYFAPLQVGDFAAVTRAGDVFRLSPQKLDLTEIEQRLADVQPRMPSVVEARKGAEIAHDAAADLRAEHRAAGLAAQEARGARTDAIETQREMRHVAHEAGELAAAAEAAADRGVKVASAFLRSFAKMLDFLDDFLFSRPPLSRDQAERAEQAAQERQEINAARHDRAAAQDDVVARQSAQQQQDRDTEDLYRRFPGLTRNASDRERDEELDRGRERER